MIVGPPQDGHQKLALIVGHKDEEQASKAALTQNQVHSSRPMRDVVTDAEGGTSNKSCTSREERKTGGEDGRDHRHGEDNDVLSQDCTGLPCYHQTKSTNFVY